MATLLTPPHSDSASDDLDLAGTRQAQPSTHISVSTTFHPDNNFYATPCDLVIISSDSVFFYAQSSLLLSASYNNFGCLLPAALMSSHALPCITVRDASPVLNVVLHAVYGLSCAQYTPSFGLLADAVEALTRYGISVDTYVAPGTPLHSLLLYHAATTPLGLYTLAASYDIPTLAISASAYLLGTPPETLTDAQVAAIPAVYVKRLFCLHIVRARELARIVFKAPVLHAPTNECGHAQLQSLLRVWSLVAASIIYEARADMPCSLVRAAFDPLVKRIGCDPCRHTVTERIKNVVGEWAKVKNTI